MDTLSRWILELVRQLTKPRYHPERRYMRGRS